MTGVYRDIQVLSLMRYSCLISVSVLVKKIFHWAVLLKTVQSMTSAPHLFVIPVFISALISVSLYIVGQDFG